MPWDTKLLFMVRRYLTPSITSGSLDLIRHRWGGWSQKGSWAVQRRLSWAAMCFYVQLFSGVISSYFKIYNIESTQSGAADGQNKTEVRSLKCRIPAGRQQIIWLQWVSFFILFHATASYVVGILCSRMTWLSVVTWNTNTYISPKWWPRWQEFKWQD